MSGIIFASLLFVTGVRATSDYHLLILHQGDFHSRYLPVDGGTITCMNEDFQKGANCYGGFARAVAYVKRMKEHPYTKAVLNVNVGDFFYGEMLHTVFKWKVHAELAKLMPYDALCFGDTELMDGTEGLLAFMRSLPNLFVCTNMDFSKFNDTLRKELENICPRHRILTIGGKKIGIVSFVKAETFNVRKVTELTLEDPFKALTREVALLKGQGVKVLVALSHSGYNTDKEVARRVPSLDVIVGGHRHLLLWPDPISQQATGVPPDPADGGKTKGPYPTVVVQPSGRRVLVVNSYCCGKYVGSINVTFDADDEVKDWWSQPKLLEESMPEDPDTKAALDDFEQRRENKSHEVIGHSLVQLVGMAEMCHQEECNLANLMGDAALWAMRSHRPDVPWPVPSIALINAGLIRNNIELGGVTTRMLTEALSWRNLIHVAIINGSTLLAVLEHGASSIEESHGRFMQVAGLSYHVDMSRPPHNRVSDVNMLCSDCMVPESEPLNMSRYYRVALTNYILDGGDGYDMLLHLDNMPEWYGILDIDLLHNYISRTSPVWAIVENRITISSPPGDKLLGQQPSDSSRLAADQDGLLLIITVLLTGATQLLLSI